MAETVEIFSSPAPRPRRHRALPLTCVAMAAIGSGVALWIAGGFNGSRPTTSALAAASVPPHVLSNPREQPIGDVIRTGRVVSLTAQGSAALQPVSGEVVYWLGGGPEVDLSKPSQNFALFTGVMSSDGAVTMTGGETTSVPVTGDAPAGFHDVITLQTGEVVGLFVGHAQSFSATHGTVEAYPWSKSDNVSILSIAAATPGVVAKASVSITARLGGAQADETTDVKPWSL